MKRLLLVAALLLNLTAVWFGWFLFEERRRAAIARDALPPIPKLDRLPRVFGDRVRLDSAAAGRLRGRRTALQELAMLYHANGFQREADRIELSLRELEPQEPRWPYYLADLRLAQGDSKEAEKFLLATLRLDSSNAAAELRVGNLLLRTGRPTDAVPHFTRRLILLPNDPYARLGLARVAIQQCQWDRAGTLLRELLRDSPGFYTAYNLLAQICEVTGDAAGAAANRQLGTSSPRFHDADDPLMNQLQAWSYDPYQLQVRGAIDMQSGQLMESLPFYEKAVRLNPQDGTGYDALGDVLLQLGRLEEARGVLEAGTVAAPEMYSIYTTLAQVLRKEGRPQAAVKVLQRALAKLPNSPEIHNDLGVALEDAGLHAEAALSYREAIRLNPAFAEAHLNFGLCLQELGDREEAEQQFRVALELRPGNGSTVLALAKSDLSAGNWGSALRRLELLLTNNPDNPEALNLIAIAHLRLGLESDKAGRTVDAEREFVAGLSADSTVAELQANLGVILTRRGEFPEAIGHFQRFVTLAPGDPIAYLYLGQALLVTHKVDEAHAMLLQGLAAAQRAGDPSAAERLHAVLDLAQQAR